MNRVKPMPAFDSRPRGLCH